MDILNLQLVARKEHLESEVNFQNKHFFKVGPSKISNKKLVFICYDELSVNKIN